MWAGPLKALQRADTVRLMHGQVVHSVKLFTWNQQHNFSLLSSQRHYVYTPAMVYAFLQQLYENPCYI